MVQRWMVRALVIAALVLSFQQGRVAADDACSPIDPCKGQGKACRDDVNGTAGCYQCLPGWNATYTEVPKNSTEKPALICTAPAVCKTSDPCKSLNKICTADQDGKAVCGACLYGYQKDPNIKVDPTKPDTAACIDIDECKASPDLCISEQRPCTNKPGGYQCGACFERWVEDSNGNCVDLDECSFANNTCAQQNRWCENFLKGKGYECRSCLTGFLEDNNVCVKQTCASAGAGCNPNAKCINTDAGPQCICPPPFAGDANNCDCADVGYSALDGRCVDVCVESWPCDPQTDAQGNHIAICNAGSCSCPLSGWSGAGTPDFPCQPTGCYPGKAKVWARSSATAKPQNINIKDLRIGDYVRCMTSPIEENIDYPHDLAWCYVKGWQHANVTRNYGMMKVTFKRADGTTGSHILTKPHFVYLLPSVTKVGTRFASLETIKGHVVRPLDLKKGDVMAAAVVTSNGAEYDGFEAVVVLSSVEYNTADTVGWYLPEIDSAYMIVDDVVASNTLLNYGWEGMFPKDTYLLANRFWFGSTLNELTALKPVYAPVGTPGTEYDKVRVVIKVDANGLSKRDYMKMLGSKVIKEGYSFNMDTCYWPWFLEAYKAHKAAPTSPSTVVTDAVLVAKFMECLVPPTRDSQEGASSAA